MKDIIIEKEDGEYSIRAVLSYTDSTLKYQVSHCDIHVGEFTISLDADEFIKFNELLAHLSRRKFLINCELELEEEE